MTGLSRRALGALAIAATLAAGSAAAPATAQERVKLRVVFPTSPSTVILPHFVAHDQGWLKDKGLDIEETWLVGDPNALRAVLAGQGDIALLGTFPVIAAVAQGGKLKAFASWQPKVDYVIVSRPELKTMASLKDARVAAASSGGLTTELPKMVMEKHGVDHSKAQFFVVGGHDARVAAVVAGKADAALVGELFAAHGKKMPPINVLSSLAKEFPNLVYFYMVTQEKDMADPAKRRAMEIYTRYAVIEGSRFIMKNPDKAAEILKKRAPDVDLGLIREVIGRLNDSGVWGVNGGLDAAAAAYTAKMAASLASAPREVKPEEFIDTSLVDKVIAEAGKM